MKYRVIVLNSITVAAILLSATILSTVTISHISKTASNGIKKLPIYCVETDEKKIAVTFDAAWSAEDTDEIIEILKKHNAKATFFCVGSWVDENPDAVKKLYKNGHEIGNHSDTHPSFSQISRSDILKEINSCNEKIKNITGNNPTLVRAPSGDYDNKSIEVTESLNMKIIQWDVDSLDWKKLSVDEMYSRVISKTQNGSILLFHNGIENTPKALDKIFTKLEKDGYKFVTVSELIYWDNYDIDHTGRQITKRSNL
ncbi:MAG: polysaccharide deacetylase family protein [Oscillospiraceae bacterium]|nr:polysaccharide deacetylase family protein [Oscillospiraceae bacterium]